jgi:hypothetical protein
MDDVRHSRDSRHGKFRERPHFPAIPAPLMKGRDAAGSKSSPGVKIDAAKLIPTRLNTSTHVERDRSLLLGSITLDDWGDIDRAPSTQCAANAVSEG